MKTSQNKTLVRRPRNQKGKPPVTDPRNMVCPIARQCKSCELIELPYYKGLNKKYQSGIETLRKNGGLPGSARILPYQGAPKKLGYRYYAKLAVRPGFNPNTFAIGLFAPGTHKLVENSDCPVHTPEINRIVSDLKVLLNDSDLTPYNEQTKSGDIRYIAIRCSHITSELSMTFVVTNHKVKHELRQVSLDLIQMGHKVSSTYLNINAEDTNAIFGRDYIKIGGADSLRESLCGLNYDIGPNVFFQVNPFQAELVYKRLEQLIGYNDTVGATAWDLYSGAGQISCLIGRLGYKTLGIEENPESIKCAHVNVKKNDLSNVSFLRGRVEEVYSEIPAWCEKPSLIMMNPSRKGLAKEVRDFFTRYFKHQKQMKMIYMSCDVQTFARDIKDLNEAGFRLRQVEAFDMFPQTKKLEWVGVFTK